MTMFFIHFFDKNMTASVQTAIHFQSFTWQKCLPRNGREPLLVRVAAGKRSVLPVLAPRNGSRASDIRFATSARERENRRGSKHNPVEHNSLSLNKITIATCRQRGARGYYHYTGNQEVTFHGQNGQRPKSHDPGTMFTTLHSASRTRRRRRSRGAGGGRRDR